MQHITTEQNQKLFAIHYNAALMEDTIVIMGTEHEFILVLCNAFLIINDSWCSDVYHHCYTLLQMKGHKLSNVMDVIH